MLDAADSESEDIVQETFIRLHRQIARKGPDSVRHLTSWLFKTAHNLTIDLLRKRSRRKQSELDVEDASQTTAQSVADELDAVSEVLRREAREVTLRELTQIDDQQRQVILLKIIQGMTLRQVAEVAGVSVSLVNYRLNQGLAELARRLRKAGVV
jgi:RNA polymerase sigma-70 factor (ECF subfamily)